MFYELLQGSLFDAFLFEVFEVVLGSGLLPVVCLHFPLVMLQRCHIHGLVSGFYLANGREISDAALDNLCGKEMLRLILSDLCVTVS